MNALTGKFCACATAIALIGAVAFYTLDSTEPGSERSVQPRTAASQTTAHEGRPNAIPQAKHRAAEHAQSSPVAPPLSAAAVREALRTVELDDYGRLVLDAKALAALRNSFARLDGELTEAQLIQLQQLIREALPASAGDETATMVVGFYRYHLAERALLAAFDDGAAAFDDIDTLNQRHRSLRALQDEHLGRAAAERLFGIERAYQRYMLDSMRLQNTPGLSASDKAILQSQLRDQLPTGVISRDVPLDQAERTAFKRRFDAYALQRDAIVGAGLSAEEQQRQLDELFGAHFSEDEAEAVRAFEERFAEPAQTMQQPQGG